MLTPFVKRMLVAEDFPGMVEALVTVLKIDMPSCVFDAAHDGKEALDMELQARPDVVLIDIVLPIADADEVAASLRAAYPDRPPFIVGIPGLPERLAVARKSPEFDAVMEKPMNFDSLMAILREKFLSSQYSPGPSTA